MRAKHFAAVFAAMTITAACATNPLTGQREFSLMSEAQEIELGRQMDVEVRREMGIYNDPDLQQYVQSVGMRLARASQRPNLPWHFAVVDVPGRGPALTGAPRRRGRRRHGRMRHRLDGAQRDAPAIAGSGREEGGWGRLLSGSIGKDVH